MRRIGSRLCTMLLAVVMLVGLLPTIVFAAEEKQFSDIKADSWYYSYVDFVTEKEFFLGTSSSTFDPEGTMTRAMFVTVLARVDGAKVNDNVKPFADVDAGTWYSGAVKWASDEKIVEGIGGGLFNPEAAITREQMCVIMDRYIEYYCAENKCTLKLDGTAHTFTDAAQISGFAVEGVANCSRWGLVEGCDDGAFRPLDNSTRAQVAAVICRLFQLLETAKPVSSGGGGGGTTAVTNYTLTLDPNYEGGTATTVTVAKNGTYTFAALTRDGYRFLSWNTAADGTGTTYNVGDTLTVTADLTLYAQWMANTDYIGQAVLSAADWAGGYVDTVNSVLDSVKDTAGNNGLAINDTLNLALTTGNMTSMEEGARTVTVTAQADLTENTVLNAARFAMDMVLPVVDGSTTPADLKQMIKDVAEQLGIELTKDQVDQMVGEIQEAAQSYLAQAMQDFKDNFRNYNGGDCITGMTLTFANGDEMTLTVGSITKNDAVQAAVKIARNLLNSANSADYTNQFDAQTSVKASFAPVDGIAASYTGEGAFPTDYTVKFVLDAQSDYLSYKLDADKGYYLKLTISQEMQNAYAGAVDELVNAALDNTTVQGKLHTVLNDALDGVSLDSYKGLLTQLGKTEEEAQLMLDGAVDAWVAANHLSAAEIKESFLFQRYWEENASAAPDNSALYALIAAIGDDAGAYVDALLREKIGDMYVEPAPGKWDDQEGYVDYALMRAPTEEDSGGLYYKMTPEVFDALISTALPGGAGFTLNINDPVQYYALGAICDYLHGLVGEETTYAADAEDAMHDAIDQKLDDMLAGNNMMTVLEKAVKAKTLEGIWNARLSNISTALTNPTLLDLVGNYDDNTYIAQLRSAFNAVVNRIPAGAMVQIGNTTLTKASLNGVVNAADNAALCQALADLITDNGLDDLSLSTFGDEATAPKITLGSASTNLAFTLVLDLEGA